MRTRQVSAPSVPPAATALFSARGLPPSSLRRETPAWLGPLHSTAACRSSSPSSSSSSSCSPASGAPAPPRWTSSSTSSAISRLTCRSISSTSPSSVTNNGPDAADQRVALAVNHPLADIPFEASATCQAVPGPNPNGPAVCPSPAARGPRRRRASRGCGTLLQVTIPSIPSQAQVVVQIRQPGALPGATGRAGGAGESLLWRAGGELPHHGDGDGGPGRGAGLHQHRDDQHLSLSAGDRIQGGDHQLSRHGGARNDR